MPPNAKGGEETLSVRLGGGFKRAEVVNNLYLTVAGRNSSRVVNVKFTYFPVANTLAII